VVSRLVAPIYTRSGSDFFLRVIHVDDTVLGFRRRLCAVDLPFVCFVRGRKDMS
jgi:hypothetical protein